MFTSEINKKFKKWFLEDPIMELVIAHPARVLTELNDFTPG